MDPQFKEWLVGRSVSRSALKAMQKEAVTNENTLRAMKDEDLVCLKEKYKLPMGQHVLLRNARDELQAGGSRVEVLKAPPRPSPVEHVRYVGHATYPEADQPREAAAWRRRMRREEIREKYHLSRGNGASAVCRTTPSPLQPHTVRPVSADRADGGLAVTSQMRELRRKGEERGKKLSALEEQTERLKGSAMDFERAAAQIAENQKKGKKRKKDKSATLQPQAEPQLQPPSRVRKSATMYPSLSSSAHTPSQIQSPLPPPSTSQRPESDPIRRSPHFMNYGSTTTGARPRSPSPVSLSYSARDDMLTYSPSPTPEMRRGKCSCCVVM